MKFLTAQEYAQLGFKCGVEIHQQLLTDAKQFCHCPAGLYSTHYDAEFLRHMRPTLSELGEYDGTALMEFKTKKEIVYRLSKESVCTYEMDDTPPFLVNETGLSIAIEMSLLLNCNIVDEIHIARKQYLDGSIPAGFQRTAIVGLDGWIPYKNRKIRIIQLSYEEDSCREISDKGHTIIFKTDRLGMPLIETVTHPDMRTPWEVAEVVDQIAWLTRAGGKVRRGLGAARQDVNVSIEGGTRIEIKGVPKIGYIPNLVHVEALRQKALLEIRDEIARRGISADNLQIQEKDVTGVLRNSSLEQFRQAMAKEKRIRAIKLCGFAGILNYPTQPDICFDRELAGRVRVIACLDEQPIIFHTDNYRLYESYRHDLKQLRKALRSNENDVILLVWGSKQDTITATEEIRLRIIDAIAGVPSETRQAFPDGTTDFERILPGPERMYPDTDLPPTKIDASRVESIKATLPELPWIREKRYLQHGIDEDSARQLAISPYANLFDRINKELEVDMKLIAVVLLQRLKHLRRCGCKMENLSEERIFEIFHIFSLGGFYREIIPHLLFLAAKHPEMAIKAILAAEKIEKYSDEKQERVIAKCLEQKPKFIAAKNGKTKLIRYYTGLAMKNLRGKANASQVIATIERLIK